MQFTKRSLVAALVVVPTTLAQTFTDCNPLEKTCPNNPGYSGSTFSTDFTKGNPAKWSAAAGTTITYGSNGAEFTIAQAGQAPTIETDFYIFFGKIDVVMQAAPGTGIVSSIVLESDDLDEIDWEFLGGDTTQVESNYFGKGDTTTYDRAIYHSVSTPQTTFHTYTIDWTSSYIKFEIDGTVIRQLNYADANGGSRFPQTPMKLKLGSWAGGAPGNAPGTIEWAGGATDFSQAPFKMYVKSINVANSNPAGEYEWTDHTGSYQSIKLIKGDGSSASAGSSSGSPYVSPVSKVAASSGSSSSSAKIVASSSSVPSVKAALQAGAATSSVSSHLTASSSVVLSTSHVQKQVTASSTAESSTLSQVAAAAVASSSSTRSGSSASSNSSSSKSAANATASSTMRQQSANAASKQGVATTLTALAGVALALVCM
ncbi:hypothetical protein AAFC00_007334 [Neodothiora populina]|uniref:Crh-like protein n=1 Tax=Neodothiora populina TaxID=2781224 RepID=A0ABR3PIB5_9PEZI